MALLRCKVVLVFGSNLDVIRVDPFTPAAVRKPKTETSTAPQSPVIPTAKEKKRKSINEGSSGAKKSKLNVEIA
jgi:hypothetical protein